MAPIKNFSDNTGPAGDDLIQLLLKRQAELNALLEITFAINKNSTAFVLYEMLEVVLRVNLNIEKMRLFVKEKEQFIYASGFGQDGDQSESFEELYKQLESFKVITPLKNHVAPALNQFEFFVPVRHKNSTLAFLLIGGFNTPPELLSHELNFIQTLVNIIFVALENKKLFRERVKRERFQREIELAEEVQNMLVPLHLPRSPRYEVASSYLPHENIGGDYFDFIRLNDHEFFWCIADVSGKGVSAALLMANLQASLRAWTSVERSVEKLIRKLNDVVSSNTKGGRFVTLFLGRYNELSREMEYVNAGHNAPILLAGGQCRFLKEGTTILGSFDVLPFVHTARLILPPDALLFNYTDGLIESDEDEVYITEEELAQYLENYRSLPAEEINKEILQGIRSGKSMKMNSDDITLLTMRIF